MGATYDAGALVAAERDDRRMVALHAGYVSEGILPTVPAPVLAQAWRGGTRQARLARLINHCVVEPMDVDQAKDVGRLAGTAAHQDIVDVTVVEGAARRGDVVVTSDPADISHIASAAGVGLRIETV